MTKMFENLTLNKCNLIFQSLLLTVNFKDLGVNGHHFILPFYNFYVPTALAISESEGSK